MCELDYVCQGAFGDYGSYLELAFAINVIFVGWLPRIRRRFRRLRRAAEQRQGWRLDTLTAQGVDADALKQVVNTINARRWHRDRVAYGLEVLTRTLCFLMATAITRALLLLGEQYEAWWVQWNWMLVAIGVPLGMVLLMMACEGVWSWRIDAHVNKAYDDALAMIRIGSARAAEIAGGGE